MGSLWGPGAVWGLLADSGVHHRIKKTLRSRELSNSLIVLILLIVPIVIIVIIVVLIIVL